MDAARPGRPRPPRPGRALSDPAGADARDGPGSRSTGQLLAPFAEDVISLLRADLAAVRVAREGHGARCALACAGLPTARLRELRSIWRGIDLTQVGSPPAHQGSAEPALPSALQAALDKLGMRSACLLACQQGELAVLLLVTAIAPDAFGDREWRVARCLAENLALKCAGWRPTERRHQPQQAAQVLHEIATAISPVMDLDRVLELVVDKARDLLGTEIAYLGLADESKHEVRMRLTRGTRGDDLARVVMRFGEGMGGTVAATCQPMAVLDYTRDVVPKPPHIQQVVAAEGIVSALCVPMLSGQRVIGVLYVASRHPRRFSEHDVTMLSTLAAQAAIAIENDRLYEHERRMVQELAALNAALQARQEELESSVAIHDRLMQFVLEDRGLQAIADALAELVNLPVVVENRLFQQLCTAIPSGCALATSVSLAAAPSWLALAQRNPQVAAQLRRLDSTRRTMRLPARPEAGIIWARVVAPITAGPNILGYISLIQSERELTQADLRTLEQTAVVFSLELMKERVAFEVEQRLYGDLLDDLLAGRTDQSAEIVRRAAHVGLALDQPLGLLVVAPAGRGPESVLIRRDSDEAQGTPQMLLRALTERARALTSQSLVVGKGEQIVIVAVPLPDAAAESSLGALLRLGQQLQAEVARIAPGLAVTVSSGGYFTGPEALKQAYDEAQLALRVARALGRDTSVVTLDQLGVYPLLVQGSDPSALRRFAERVLQPLLRYDRDHHSQFVQTLEAYLQHGANLRETAAATFVHLNTLRYRLQRIEELGGFDLRDPEVQLNCQLALRIRRIAGQFESEPDGVGR